MVAIILPFLFILAPVTLSPIFFSTGMLSPVSIDSSTEVLPSMTIPSTGILLPGLTIITSPTSTSSIGVSISFPQAVKCGLSIYNYERSLNLYGLKDFVNKLPTVNINKEDLLGYEIISL